MINSKPRRRLRIDAKALGSHSTDLQIAKIVERANRLKRQIDAWAAVQSLYMPAVAPLRVPDDSDSLSAAANGDLFLPSQVIARDPPIPVGRDLIDLEWRLRYAQSLDALHEIRRLILVRTKLYKSKDAVGKGQKHNTRSNNLIRSVEQRIQTNIQKYREFRVALERLAPHLGKVGWGDELKPLTDQDVKGLSRDENDTTEGRIKMSWIWHTHDGRGDEIDGPRMQEGE